MKPGYVYIMANRRNGAIYLGVTSDLPHRTYQHRRGVGASFTKQYRCKRLVWFEAYEDLQDARQRELQMKKWKRAWKLRDRGDESALGRSVRIAVLTSWAPAFAGALA
jgi:putative endonuclease